jgi:hypothetical protein
MIFESPDGGKTVTIRASHTLNKQTLDLDPLHKEQVELDEKWIMWKDILWASQTNPVLKESLDRVQIIYELSRREV